MKLETIVECEVCNLDVEPEGGVAHCAECWDAYVEERKLLGADLTSAMWLLRRIRNHGEVPDAELAERIEHFDLTLKTAGLA